MISILIFLSLTSSILNYVSYDLTDGEAKEISKLSKGIDYYFYIEANEDQKVNIEINMDYISNQPFSYLYIYEHSTRYGYITRSAYYNVYNSTKNGKIFISQTYSVSRSLTSYVSIKITPDYDITHFKITVDVSGLSTLAIVLLSTLIPLFFCVIICIVIFVVLKKRRTINVATQNQLIASTQPNYVPAQPLYVPPQPGYAPVQPQYIPPPQQQYNQQILAPGQPY